VIVNGAMNWLRKLDRLVLNFLTMMIALMIAVRVAVRIRGCGNEQESEDCEGAGRSTTSSGEPFVLPQRAFFDRRV
jgi:hypothetical protein